MSNKVMMEQLRRHLEQGAKYAAKAAEIERKCLHILQQCGLADDDLELVSPDPVKLRQVCDYWTDTLHGFGGNPDRLADMLEELLEAK